MKSRLHHRLLCLCLLLLAGAVAAPRRGRAAAPVNRLLRLVIEPLRVPACAAAPGGDCTATPSPARVLRLQTRHSPDYTLIRMSGPERAILDVIHTELGELQSPGIAPDDPVFAAVTLRQLPGEQPRIARVTVTLREGASYDVSREGESLVLRARSPATAPTPQQRAAAALKKLMVPSVVAQAASRATPTPQTPEMPQNPAVAQAASRATPTPQTPETPRNTPAAHAASRATPILHPAILRLPLPLLGPPQPEEAYLLDFPAAAAPQIHTQNLSDPSRLVIDIDGVAFPALPRSLAVHSRFVHQLRQGDRRGGTRLVFDRTDAPSVAHLQRTATGGRVTFTARPARQPVVQVAAPQTAAFISAAQALSRDATVADLQQPISLDVRDTDIINVLRLISEKTGENIIASDEVKGKVTLKLRDVPADQALDTLLRTKGFDRVRRNNILRVATAESIQKERDMDLARRRAVLEVEETVIRMETVNYATATEIAEQIRPMLTARGSIQVNSRTNTLIVQDVPANVEKLIGLTRRLDKQTPLVMIQARIVEANTSSMQDLGIQWGGSSQQSSRTNNPTGLMFPGDVVVNGGADNATNQIGGIATPAHYAVNLPATLGGQGASLGFILGSANGSQILNLRLSAMESNGNGKVISSPEVATLDNKTARVSQGVEIPVSVTSAAGVNTRFIPAVLELEVTPHVTNDGTVLLRIKTQKSEADFTNRGAAGDPTIQKRYAETEVLVRDGDTSVIGGIYTRNTGDTYNSVPFLSRIPLLGSLFRRHAHQDTRAELLVFITPRIINREESMIHNTNAAQQTPAAPTAH